ncbi:fucose mutarotase-like isoform X1 [Tachypleus tridentatus]|uniref:fucose mutarotase-like isoform X1 n=1 Tax=Tachypleus tridentatus TaxID=6853 RepID=UPI003FD3AE07
MTLKGIPNILSPDLLHVLCSMGHGDEIVLADTHFPTSSICRLGPKEIRADGHGIPDLLYAILKLMPLDTYVYAPVALMEVVQADKLKNLKTPIWDTYKQIIHEVEGREVPIQEVERFDFYEQAKAAFAIVHTGETAQYGNIILKKGVVNT